MNHQDPAPGRLTVAERIRLLMDAYELTHHEPLTYGQVAAALTAKGVGLSRSRWQYLIGGQRNVGNVELLTALADFFDTDPGFLTDDGPMPDTLAAQVHLIRAMRAADVQEYAARRLGELSPDTYRALASFLEQHIAAERADPPAPESASI